MTNLEEIVQKLVTLLKTVQSSKSEIKETEDTLTVAMSTDVGLGEVTRFYTNTPRSGNKNPLLFRRAFSGSFKKHFDGYPCASHGHPVR